MAIGLVILWSGFGFPPLANEGTNYHFEMPLVWFWLCPLPWARTLSNCGPFCHISGLVLASTITLSKDQSFWCAAGLVLALSITPSKDPFELQQFSHLSGLALALSITSCMDLSCWYAAGMVLVSSITPSKDLLLFFSWGFSLSEKLSFTVRSAFVFNSEQFLAFKNYEHKFWGRTF